MNSISESLNLLIEGIHYFCNLDRFKMFGIMEIDIVSNKKNFILKYKKYFDLLIIEDPLYSHLSFEYKTNEMKIIMQDYDLVYLKKASSTEFENKFRNIVNIEKTIILLQEKMIGII